MEQVNTGWASLNLPYHIWLCTASSEKQSGRLQPKMADIFLSNLFNAISVWTEITPEVNNIKKITSEGIPMDLIILKFIFSYEYKAGKQLHFKLMIKKRLIV